MWRLEFPDAVVYRFRDWSRRRAALLLLGGSLILGIAAAAWPWLLAVSLLLAAASALVLFRMRHLVIDRARRLLLLEERRPFRQTIRRILSLDCVRLRLEMKPVRWGRDSYQSLWIEDQCQGERIPLLERSSSLRCDTSSLESDLGRPLLVVVRS